MTTLVNLWIAQNKIDGKNVFLTKQSWVVRAGSPLTQHFTDKKLIEIT